VQKKIKIIKKKKKKKNEISVLYWLVFMFEWSVEKRSLMCTKTPTRRRAPLSLLPCARYEYYLLLLMIIRIIIGRHLSTLLVSVFVWSSENKYRICTTTLIRRREHLLPLLCARYDIIRIRIRIRRTLSIVLVSIWSPENGNRICTTTLTRRRAPS